MPGLSPFVKWMTSGKPLNVQCVRRLPGYSSPWVLRGLAVCLLLVSGAWVGAGWQAAKTRPWVAVRQQALDARLQGETARLHESLAQLATRVGELQGRVVALEALRPRLSQAAGLIYTAPELASQADGGPAGRPAVAARSDEAAAVLGRHIDDLAWRLSHEADAYALVEVALARQAGLHAGLPTASPLRRPYESSSFGWRRNPVSGRYALHQGLDFAAPRGTLVRAASGGVVLRAGPVRGYGRMVELDHGNGLRSRYAHAATILVRPGDIVRQGDAIARVGSSGRSTGTHLHFEIRVADHALDPALFVRPDAPVANPPVAATGQASPLAGRPSGVPAGG